MSSTPFVLQREAGSVPFVAEVGDKTISLRHFGDLDQFEVAELFGRADDMADVEFMVEVLRLAADDDNLETLRGLKLRNKELRALYHAYQAHTGADVGESPASSD